MKLLKIKMKLLKIKQINNNELKKKSLEAS